MMLEIDGRCNLSCKMCPRRFRKDVVGPMTPETFKEAIDKLVQSDFPRIVFAAGFGESMLNEHFVDMIKYAKRKGCRIILPTNSTKIDEENVKWLRLIDLLQLSLDSLKNSERRTQDPQDVLSKIPLLKEWDIPFMFNVTLCKLNYDEIDDFLLYGLNNRITMNFIASQATSEEDTIALDDVKFVASRWADIQRKIDHFPNTFLDVGCRSFERGRARLNDFTVAWNGNMYPCCGAFCEDYSFGHLSDFDSFDAFWNSDDEKRVQDGIHPLCDNCKAIDQIWNKCYNTKSEKQSRISEMKNSLVGKKCFVLGAGESVTKDVVEKLRNEVTIAVGHSLNVESEFGYTPTYTCISDIHTIVDPDYLNMLQTSKTIPLITTQVYHQAFDFKMHLSEEAFKTMRRSIEIPYIDTVGHSDDEVSLDLEKGTFIRGTVVQDLGIPLASWMGCKNIYLVGCDGHGGYFYDKSKQVYIIPRVSKQYKNYSDALSKRNQNLINLSDSVFEGVENGELEGI